MWEKATSTYQLTMAALNRELAKEVLSQSSFDTHQSAGAFVQKLTDEADAEQA